MRYLKWWSVGLALTCVFAAPVVAQEQPDAFPSRTVRIVVGFTPGGAPDVTARILAQKLTELWKQPVIVENRAGAGSALASQYVANAAPDGYTLMSATSSHAVLPAINSQLPYDARKDLAGVTMTSTAPTWILISPTLGIKTLRDFIAYGKANPDKMNYGSAGVGSLMHFGGELFVAAAGIKAQHVPYKGPPEALTDTVTGRVQFVNSPIGAASALVKDGKLIPLAVTGTKRLKDFPDVPTMSEAGLPAFQLGTWTGLLAPSRISPGILAKLNRDITAILKQPDVLARWNAFGVEPAPTTPAEYDKAIAADIDAFTQAARTANIQVK